jgi:transposase
MVSLPSGPDVVHVGMDTSAREIVYGVLRPGREVPAVDRIPSDGESVRRLIGKLGDRRLLSVCYEAGPSGYELHRLLASMGVACQVIAPSLVPKGASERVKTDRRDAVRLTLALRAGLLTAVRVPSPEEEAVRDLVRARADLLDDRKRTQQRLSAVLLRHGRVWGGGAKWTWAHRQWVDRQEFDEAALGEALDAYRGALEAREAELRAIEARLSSWAGRDPLAAAVARLGAYRGIAELTALTLAAEIVDWHRFPAARAFMGFTGLIPAEYSSGTRTRRGSITKAGPGQVRTALTESAWAYRHRPAIGAGLKRRQAGADPATLARSWKAQQRLHATWTKMTARGKPAGVTATAVARELAGFVWAEMTS